MTKTNNGSCHCEAVSFRVDADISSLSVFKCNCSFCSMRAISFVSVPVSDFQLLSAQNKSSCYQWNTQTAQHYFCQQCGVHTHYVRRSDPSQMGINYIVLNRFSQVT